MLGVRFKNHVELWNQLSQKISFSNSYKRNLYWRFLTSSWNYGKSPSWRSIVSDALNLATTSNHEKMMRDEHWTWTVSSIPGEDEEQKKRTISWEQPEFQSGSLQCIIQSNLTLGPGKGERVLRRWNFDDDGLLPSTYLLCILDGRLTSYNDWVTNMVLSILIAQLPN